MSTFGSLESDFKRVAYVLGLDVTQNIAPVPMFRTKNAQEALGLMVQAEALIEKGSSGAALNLLSRAITKAPGSGEQRMNECTRRI
jgi:hypothetical protein